MAEINDVITKSVSFMLQSGTTLAPFGRRLLFRQSDEAYESFSAACWPLTANDVGW